MLYELSQRYPNLMTIESVHSKFDVPHQFGTCGHTQCSIFLVTITDKTYNNPNKGQVYISGAVHGNERVGPHVVAYLTEYLLNNYNSNDFVRKLLQEREILLTPFVNPSGFFYDRREELADDGTFYDINRDFPYNRAANDFGCFSTVGSRATFKIFQDNLILGALSYHGGMQTIGYNWGSFNHMNREEKATESPDDSMYSRIAGILQEQSHVEFLDDLPVGPMTDLIYA